MTRPTWPPFSGDDSKCPKCGQDGPDTQWRSAYEPGPDEVSLVFRPMSDFGPERLRRTCLRCEYWWDEAIVSEQEVCGAWGGCPMPKGHNMGRADIPENHAGTES